MCAIFGALTWCVTGEELFLANVIQSKIFKQSHVRGRDGRGYQIHSPTSGPIVDEHETCLLKDSSMDAPLARRDSFTHTLIGNCRAEPTTEYVAEKNSQDQQPYSTQTWSIVHNGTIANDKELRQFSRSLIKKESFYPTNIDSAAIVELLEAYTTNIRLDPFEVFEKAVKRLKGSYAILAVNHTSSRLMVAANYRPIWFIKTDFGVFFASTRDSFPDGYVPQMLTPYTVMEFAYYSGELHTVARSLHAAKGKGTEKALVVCSGGLDSVVAATYAKDILAYDIELIHFLYGSRAEGPEVKAVQAIAKELGVPLKLFNLPVYDKSDSPLLNADATVAGGEEGAEFAHEWVPARNLLLLSVATAYAEAKGFRWLVLGNNLEEAGAYPDNEPEFIAKFNDMLPFAVGDGKQLSVIMPVGNMMKHEIVELGQQIGAPMHLTWSCYRAGELHCGKCGPCFMRRTAFEINKLDEVIQYEL